MGERPMNEANMRQFLIAKPFEPFMVVMSSGKTHWVKHPENAVLTKTKLVIVDPEQDLVIICALLHISSVETQQTA
jgi:hypothetical protein